LRPSVSAAYRGCAQFGQQGRLCRLVDESRFHCHSGDADKILLAHAEMLGAAMSYSRFRLVQK
jgi:hypothetical protein